MTWPVKSSYRHTATDQRSIARPSVQGRGEEERDGEGRGGRWKGEGNRKNRGDGETDKE